MKLKTWMLAGLQTFGGDMKTHIHEHCIVVDGGIDQYSQIVKVSGDTHGIAQAEGAVSCVD